MRSRTESGRGRSARVKGRGGRHDGAGVHWLALLIHVVLLNC